MLTVVSMLSSDNLFIQPHNEVERKVALIVNKALFKHVCKAAGKAHASFSSIDGDFVSLINIYQGWIQVTNGLYHSLRKNCCRPRKINLGLIGIS
jgi:hypothetical protein